jgi:hypothetical protein
MRAVFTLTVVLACAVLLPARQQAVPAGDVKPELTPAQIAELTPAQIVERVRRAYAECKTYKDRAIANCSHGEETAGDTQILTAFTRSGRLRLEMTTMRLGYYEYRYVVWCGDGKVKSWWDSTGTADAESLDAALLGASDECDLAAQLVPRLLFPELAGGSALLQIGELVRVKDDHGCLRLDGTLRGGKVALWVDPDGFLLREITVSYPPSDVRTGQRVIYAPAANGEVSERDLQFDPHPLAKVDVKDG